MKGPETKILRRIRAAILEEYPGSVIVKYWGGEFSEIGVSDLLCCIRGSFVAFEVKVPGKKPEDAQIVFLDRVRRAGGLATFVQSSHGALQFLKENLNGQ